MITVKRGLRTGTTVWEGLNKQAKWPKASLQSTHYDIVIIGAGISGSMVAEAVSHDTGRYLVIDRRTPARGSTAASTALIQWEIDEPLSVLVGKIGPAKASQTYRASYEGVKSLARRIRSLNIDCDMVHRDALLIAGNTMGAKALMGETRLRRTLSLPSQFLDAKMLKQEYGFEREGAILSGGNIEADPVKLSQAMLKLAIQRGVEIMTPATVTSMSAHRHGVLLGLDTGALIAARRVIVATGYEVLPEIPGKDYDIASTWAL